MTVGSFRYVDPETVTKSSKPWAKVDADVSSYARTSVSSPVLNIRGSEASFSTDISGFSVHHFPASEVAFTDETAIRTGYYAEVEAALRANLPAPPSRIVIFDHTIRRREKSSPRQPVQGVHVDQTPKAAIARVRRHLPADEADELLQKRFQIVNVWRPIGHPATDMPLAVIDWRSTSPEDLVAVDLLYPLRPEGDDGDDRGKEVLPEEGSAMRTEGYEVKGETYGIAPSNNHKFYYMKDMTPEEVMFIKCFDSWSEGQPNGKDGIAALTPHTAFVDPDTPADALGRQSIEVRCLIFYD